MASDNELGDAILEETLAELMEVGEYESILDRVTEVLRESEGTETVYFYMIRALTHIGLARSAIPEAECALNKFPDSHRLHYAAAWAYLGIEEEEGNQRTLKARDHLIEASSLSPDNSVYLRDLGEVYLINRDPERAATYLSWALRWNPKNADYLARLGLALLRLERKEEALLLVDQALELAKEDEGDTFDTCGMVALLSADLGRAKALFQRATKIQPNYEYFKSHMDWVAREEEDLRKREDAGRHYTPLYLRQKQRNRYFNEQQNPPPLQPLVDLKQEIPVQALLALSRVADSLSSDDPPEQTTIMWNYLGELIDLGYTELRQRIGEDEIHLAIGSSERCYKIRTIIMEGFEDSRNIWVHTECYTGDGSPPMHSGFEMNPSGETVSH